MSNRSPTYRVLSPEEMEAQIRRNLLAKRRTALLFGALAGSMYAAVGWGIDSYQLAISRGILPWLPFLLALVPCVAVTVLTAFASYRINQIFVSFVLWLAAGFCCAWMTSRISFVLYPLVLKRLSPDLAAHLDYAFYRSIEARNVIVIIAVTALFVLAGLLSINLIENFAESAAIFGRIMPILAWLALFGIAGYVPRDNYNFLLSEPVAGANTWVQFVVDNEGVSLPKETRVSMRVSAAEPIQDLLRRPRRLILTSYDEWFTTSHVLIDFDGIPVSCWMIDNKVSTCEQLTNPP